MWRGGGHIARQLLRTKHQIALSKSCACCLQAASSKAAFFPVCHMQKYLACTVLWCGSLLHYSESFINRIHRDLVLMYTGLFTIDQTLIVNMLQVFCGMFYGSGFLPQNLQQLLSQWKGLGSWRNISAQGLLDELFPVWNPCINVVRCACPF